MVNMNGFDFTFPISPITGTERTLSDLSKPDERSIAHGLTLESLQSPYLEIDKQLPEVFPRMLRDRIEVSRQLAVYGYFCHEFHTVSMSWSISCIEMALKLKFREQNPEPLQLRRQRNGVEEVCESHLTDFEKRFLDGWRISGRENFDYSFARLLEWAFQVGLLPDDIPIPVQEIVHGFNNRFTFDLFFNAAHKDGLIGPTPTQSEITSCWFGLTDEQREHYRYKASGVLIEELPRLADCLAHPDWCNSVVGPRSSLSAYQLLIDVVSRLWIDPNKPTGRDRGQHQEQPSPDQGNQIAVHAERITLYDSVHISAGSQMPDRITFSFGADGVASAEQRLFDLSESQLIEQVVGNPMLMARLLEHFGIEYPNCWIITELLTRSASSSWSHSKPGDLDIVCGKMLNGHPDFDSLCCAQVKIRKVKTLDETGSFASGAGTEQSHWTAKMGFDRTILWHWIVREPQQLPEGYAASWNSIINADFERAAKSCYGTIRQKFETDRELYGFGWIGWGQAYGKGWETCGGFATDLVYTPPHRPALDSDEARKTRAEMIESFRMLISTQVRSSLHVIQRKGK
jgi:hypothetical protein